MIKVVYLVLLILTMMGCTPKAAKEKYFIPYGFKGQVFIFFNRKNDGAVRKYEKGFRIYNIPADGILKTQFKPNYGYQDLGQYVYVYVDSFGKETVLKARDRDYMPVDRNEVYITAQETGSGGVVDKYEYQTFNVKTIGDNLILANRDLSAMDSVLKKAGLKR